MTFESLLSEISDLGWYVYAIHEEVDLRYPFRWSCTIRKEAREDSKVSHGEGQSMIEALSIAIDRIPDATPHQPDKPAYSIETKPALSAILANLLPKKQKIDRRL